MNKKEVRAVLDQLKNGPCRSVDFINFSFDYEFIDEEAEEIGAPWYLGIDGYFIYPIKNNNQIQIEKAEYYPGSWEEPPETDYRAVGKVSDIWSALSKIISLKVEEYFENGMLEYTSLKL